MKTFQHPPTLLASKRRKKRKKKKKRSHKFCLFGPGPISKAPPFRLDLRRSQKEEKKKMAKTDFLKSRVKTGEDI
jgi:hypothetical protein